MKKLFNKSKIYIIKFFKYLSKLVVLSVGPVPYFFHKSISNL